MPSAWEWGGWAVYALIATAALWRMPWYWLRRPDMPVRFAAFTVAVLVLWRIRASLGEGVPIHFLGATGLTLAFGPALAALSLSLVLLGTTLRAGAGFAAFGLNGLLVVALPVLASYAWARATERFLPSHLFVYFFVAAFFGAAFAVLTSALSVCALLAAAGRIARVALVDNYLPSIVLLLFPEAFLNGGFVTLAAVYRPHWLVSYRDRDYLPRRD